MATDTPRTEAGRRLLEVLATRDERVAYLHDVLAIEAEAAAGPRSGREGEAYDAGRLAGYEEGLEAAAGPGDEGLREALLDIIRYAEDTDLRPGDIYPAQRRKAVIAWGRNHLQRQAETARAALAKADAAAGPRARY
jgi:hypothetical protein